MKHQFNSGYIHHCFQFMVLFVVVDVCANAVVTPSKEEVKSTPVIITQQHTTGAAIKSETQSSHDYDNQIFKHDNHMTMIQPKTKGGGNVENVGNPRYVENLTQAPPRPPSVWETSPTWMDGQWNERYKWLREHVRRLKQLGLKKKIDVLQDKFSKINLTTLAQSYNSDDMDFDLDNSNYYYHLNGTYQWRAVYGDVDDGHSQNDTFIPSAMDGRETDDEFFSNGTWFAGVRDSYQGYYNNTYYLEEVELPDGESEYNYNDTVNIENANGGNGQEEADQEELVWSQLHYPKWKNTGVNNSDKNRQQALTVQNQQQKLLLQTTEAYSASVSPRQHTQQKESGILQGSAETSAVQHGQSYKRPPVITVGGNSAQKRTQITIQDKMGGAASQHGTGIAARNSITQTGTVISSAGIRSNTSENAEIVENKHTNEQVNPPVTTTTITTTTTTPTTISWGIILAGLLGAVVVIAPLICLLYKYRQEKRIKRRTFLRRSEHGSVDKRILDALIMSELGEKAQHVRHIGKTADGMWKPEKHMHTDSRTYSTEMDMPKTRYDLQLLPTRKNMTSIRDDPRVFIS